jgi:L-fuconolactonase
VSAPRVVDAHVHFWDPGVLPYPWLDEIASLRRAFLPPQHAAATAGAPVERLVVVEGNCQPARAREEVRWVEALERREPRIAALVAYVDLTSDGAAGEIEHLAAHPLVRGVRHNIQGNPSGFCLRSEFVAGVREAGRRGLTFDLCATHDQLADVLALARLCPDTALVLDHCGKPPIGDAAAFTPWAERVGELAALPQVRCKLSGLLTEAAPEWRDDEHLLPYAERVLECFGRERLLFGGDWPVVTLAGTWQEWYDFTRRFTAAWSDAERAAFYAGNAERLYGLDEP